MPEHNTKYATTTPPRLTIVRDKKYLVYKGRRKVSGGESGGGKVREFEGVVTMEKPGESGIQARSHEMQEVV